ncbi:MAG: HEAT repeat domain-containing protein, partial [Myxococcales bacterium]|nr:HEAT repeat domain-containing protein [Myxococcales bacterium]
MIAVALENRLALPKGSGRHLGHLCALGFSIFFATVFSTSVSEALFLTNVGASQLPWFFLITAVVSVPVAALVVRGMDRARTSTLLIAFSAVSAAVSVGVRLALESHHPAAFYAMYVGMSVIELQLEIAFFVLLSDFLTTSALKRTMVFVAMSVALGGLVGGLAIGPLHSVLATEDLFLVLPAVFMLICAQLYALRRRPELDAGQQPEEFGLGKTLRVLPRLASRYPIITMLALNVVFLVLVHCVAEYRAFDIYASTFVEQETLAAFMGMLNAILKVLEFVVVYAVTRPLLRRIGVGSANAVYPVASLAAFAVLLFSPGVLAAMLVSFVYRTLSYAVAQPVETLNYNAVPRRWVGRLRLMVDGIIYPIGLCVAGFLLLSLGSLSGRQITLVACVLSLLLLVFGLLTASRYYRSLVSLLRNRTVSLKEVSENLINLPASMGPEVRLLLRSEDPHQVRLGLALAEKMGSQGFRNDLDHVLEHGSGPLCEDVVACLERQRVGEPADVLMPLIELTNEQARACGLVALLREQTTRYRFPLNRCVSDASPKVRSLGLVAAYYLGDRTIDFASVLGHASGGRANTGKRMAIEAIKQGGLSPKTELISEVLIGADEETQRRGLGVLADLAGGIDPLLVPVAEAFIHDSDPFVRAAAVGLLGTVAPKTALPMLAEAMNDRDSRVRDHACQQLVQRGESAIPVLRELLEASSPLVTQAAMDVLGAVATKAAHEAIESGIEPDIEQVRGLLSWDELTSAHREFWNPIRLATQDIMFRCTHRILSAIAALGHREAAERALRLLRSKNPQARADALEALSSVGHRWILQPLLDLLEVWQPVAALSEQPTTAP